QLGERVARMILEPYGIRFAQAVAVAREHVRTVESPSFGFPVVLKIDAPHVAHKTEIGGVQTGIADLATLRGAAVAMIERVGVDGVLVAETLSGIEMLAGIVVDDVFGPTIVLGMGGIFTETLRDVARRFAPFDRTTAREMIDDLRAAPVLHGARTGVAYDLDALADLLVALSWFAADNAERLAEVDLNPVFLRPKPHGVVAADALIVTC
ncbi:MAG: acetate--CoA ligase family protein, partial [Candidatus Eremiobacteraeota bacterium]|nr:acetate--CoA ligase family protein [Candidatus Eremiobacteraeota bacterium]